MEGMVTLMYSSAHLKVLYNVNGLVLRALILADPPDPLIKDGSDPDPT
jgi:hypothetical protein